MSDKMKERVQKWLESLDEEEKNQVELLDAYFTFRTNMPGEDPGFGKASEEPKTTEEIMDDLTPMMTMSSSVRDATERPATRPPRAREPPASGCWASSAGTKAARTRIWRNSPTRSMHCVISGTGSIKRSKDALYYVTPAHCRRQFA